MTSAIKLEHRDAACAPGSGTSRRYVIVNADDFGRSEGTNAGILRAHLEGIVTSTSLMVRWPAAIDAVARSRDCPRLGLGLHLDLGEWTNEDGQWRALYEVVPTGVRDFVAGEINRQLDTFHQLVGRPPTHLDSHQHVHRHEPARSLMLELAAGLNVPLRHFDRRMKYRGDFYGQAADGTPLDDAITVPALLNLLAGLPPGVSEIGCHPGFDDELPTMYARQRRQEVATLCDPRVRSAIGMYGIELVSFADVAALTTKGAGHRGGLVPPGTGGMP